MITDHDAERSYRLLRFEKMVEYENPNDYAGNTRIWAKNVTPYYLVYSLDSQQYL